MKRLSNMCCTYATLKHSDIDNEPWMLLMFHKMVIHIISLCFIESSIRVVNQYWNMMTMATCVMIPPSPVVLNYLRLHLRRYGMLENAEEGKFARFCARVRFHFTMYYCSIVSFQFTPYHRYIHLASTCSLLRVRTLNLEWITSTFQIAHFICYRVCSEHTRIVVESILLPSKRSCSSLRGECLHVWVLMPSVIDAISWNWSDFQFTGSEFLKILTSFGRIHLQRNDIVF